MTEKNSRTNRNLRSSLLLFLLAISCGSSDDDRAVRIFKGAAIKEGVVTGFVLDDETEVPVAAEVLVGGTAVRAQPDGSFQASAVPGRVRVEVRSEGYLKTFRDVVSGDKSVPMPFKVAHRAPKMPVGPAGGTVAFRGATLVVAPGAFAAETPVALTFLSRIRVAAVSATPQFINQTGVPRRAVALVDVDADAAAMVGMRARVPVPMDATMESVSGFTIDGSGNWTTAIAPTAVANGFADFIFNGNGQIGVAVDVRKADGNKLGYIVTERGGSGKAQGDLIEGGMEIVVGNRPAAFVDQHGSRVEMAPGTRARVEVPAGAMPAVASRAPYSGEVTVNAGRARVVVPPPTAGAQKSIKLAMHGTAGKYNVTGTALTLATCLNGTDFLDFLEVVEGTVEVEAGSGMDKKTETVNQNESALVCTNCKKSPTPVCMEAPGPDGGMTTTPPTQRLDGAAGAGPEAGAPGSDAAPAVDVGSGTDAGPVSGDASSPGAEGGTQPPPPPADAGVADAAPMPDAAQPTPDAFGGPFDAASLPPPTPIDAAPAPMAMLMISPSSHYFGQAIVLTSGASQTFTVTNVGNSGSGPVQIMSSGEFALTGNGCTDFLASGASCTVTMQFRPQGTGGRSGTLTASALPGGSTTASLSGLGIPMNAPPPDAAPVMPDAAPVMPDAAPVMPDTAPIMPDTAPVMPDTAPIMPDAMPDAGQALFDINPRIHEFWAAQGDSDPKTRTPGFPFTITNVGQVPSALSWDLTGKDPGLFEFVGDTCDTVVDPGKSCEIRIQFNAFVQDTSTRSAVLLVTDDFGNTTTADLIGRITESTGFLRIEPAMHDFGALSSTFLFTVRNTSNPDQAGSVTFSFISFAIEQTGSSFSNPESNTCFGPLGPGATCSYGIFFNGQVLGRRSAILRAKGMLPNGVVAGEATAQMFGGSSNQF